MLIMDQSADCVAVCVEAVVTLFHLIFCRGKRRSIFHQEKGVVFSFLGWLGVEQ
jgi:hypothetical protein